MLGVVVLEDGVTLIAHLAGGEKNKNMLLTECQVVEDRGHGVRGSTALSCERQTLRLCNSCCCYWQVNIPLDAKVLTWWPVAEAARVTHQDEGVGFPVGRGDLIRQPGGDGLGRLDAELRDGLGHQVHPVQKTLRRVAVVLQETVRLEEQKEFSLF